MEVLTFKVFNSGVLGLPIECLSSIVDKSALAGHTTKPAMLPDHLAYWYHYRGEIVPVVKASCIDSVESALSPELVIVLEDPNSHKKIGLPCHSVSDIITAELSAYTEKSGCFITDPKNPEYLITLLNPEHIFNWVYPSSSSQSRSLIDGL